MTMMMKGMAHGLLRAAMALVAVPFGLVTALGRWAGILAVYGGALMLWRAWDHDPQAMMAGGVVLTGIAAQVAAHVARMGWDRLADLVEH